MRIFIAGASGVIGRHLVPLLVADGHRVGAMTRSERNVDLLERLGATPIVCDVYRPEKLHEVMADFRPDVVMQQLTDLPDDVAMVSQYSSRNDRMRREGTRHMLRAAEISEVDRFFVQSVAWQLPGSRGAAVADMEERVLKAEGVVLRYGQLFGPGTFYPADKPAAPRIHVHEAARWTVEALDAEPRQILTIAE